MSFISLQTKIDFIENVVIYSFGDPAPFPVIPGTSNDEIKILRIEWIRTSIDSAFPNLSDAEKNQLIWLSNTIHTLEEAKAQLAKAEDKLDRERQFLLQQAQQAQQAQQQVTPDIQTLLRQAGRTTVLAPIVSAMLEHYGSQVTYAVSSRQLDILNQYYEKAAKIPKTTTMRTLGCDGYTMNGPLNGNENLIICFDVEAKPHLLKCLDNADEIHRVDCFSREGFSHPHVTSFEYRYRGADSAVMIMPIFPFTLHSLTLNQQNSEIISKKLISQISGALEALHAIEYCHMDIKPSNIAIDNEGNFVLIDLGSVARFNEPTECTDLFLPSEDRGTYGRYIATEKRDWLMLAMTVYSKLNSSNWDGQRRISLPQLIKYLQSCNSANTLVEKINRI